LLFLSTDAFKLMVAMDWDEMVFKQANQTTQSAVRRWWLLVQILGNSSGTNCWVWILGYNGE
jgi:hypothetical protein